MWARLLWILLVLLVPATVLAATNTPPTFIVSDGLALADIGTDDFGHSVAVQADGRIVVVSSGGGDFVVLRYLANGTLDTSFGGDGIVTTDLYSGDYAYAVAIQANGKIVVAGESAGNFAVTRYNADGTLDTGFSDDGIVITDVLYSDTVSSLAIQGDGKILAAGTCSRWNSTQDFVVVRYNSDGTLDAGFGGDGIVTTNIGVNTYDTANAIAVQTDGKIILAGISSLTNYNYDPYCSSCSYNAVVVRYASDGTLDSDFDTDGMVITGQTAAAFAVKVQSDGKVLVGGAHNDDFVLNRYNDNGSLDNTFDTDGIATANIASQDVARSLAVQADGKILLGGTSRGWPYISAIVRFNTNGTIDTTFGTLGKATIAKNQINIQGQSIALQADGKILLAGEQAPQSGPSSNDELLLARYTADGYPDRTFSPAENTLNATPAYTESWGPILLDGDVAINDAELSALGNYAGATLTVERHGEASDEDVFSSSNTNLLTTLSPGSYFAVDSTTIGRVNTNSEGTLVLEFNANATQELVSKAMQRIAYHNTSEAPPLSVQIDWSFDDGNAGAQGTGGAMSAAGNVVVSITPQNDGPLYTGSYLHLNTLVDHLLSYTLPEGAFTDPDGDALSYSISMCDGTGVPPWLQFDSATRTLSGTPGAEDTGNFCMEVTARDPSGWGRDSSLSLSVVTNFPPTTPPDALRVPVADVDGTYTVQWTARWYPDDSTYILEEATDSGFTTGLRVVYEGPEFSTTTTGRTPDVTYYYRVKTRTAGYADSEWRVAENGCIIGAYNTPPTFFVPSGMVSMNSSSDTHSYSVAVQPDGKIVATVEGNFVYDPYNYNYSDFNLVRYNADGSLDQGFGDNGIVTTDIKYDDRALKVVVQADGRIVAAGQSNGDLGLVRYVANGTLDPTFGGNGKVVVSLGGGDNTMYIGDMALQANGKIIVVGRKHAYSSGLSSTDLFIIRLNGDGSLDEGFSGDGIVTLPQDSTSPFYYQMGRIAVQSDGKILIAGGVYDGTTTDPVLLRFNADGNTDTSFDGDGTVVGNNYPGVFACTAKSVSLQGDGKILLLGHCNLDSELSSVLLARYHANGSLDTTFDSDGVATVVVDPSAANGGDEVVAQVDGRLLVLGEISSDEASERVLIRFNADGSINYGYGVGGVVKLPHSYVSMALQGDGKVVLTGYSGNNYCSEMDDYCEPQQGALARYNSDGSPDRSFGNAWDSLMEGAWSNHYTEGGAPVILSPNAAVFDAELASAGNYASATLTIERHYPQGSNPADIFSAKTGGNLTALNTGAYFAVNNVTIGRVLVNSDGILTLQFNANATQTLVDLAMQQIAYRNASDSPPGEVYLKWMFNDGNTGAQGAGGAKSITDSVPIWITPVNDPPVLANPLPDKLAGVNTAFSWRLPDNTFTDPDGDALRYYTLSMADGTALPPWLNFDPDTRTLFGMPGMGDLGSINITANVWDASYATASDAFQLTVTSSAAATPASITVPVGDTDGSYSVNWGASSTPGATHLLEEATNDTFTSNLSVVYIGTGTNVALTGRSLGSIYYYRVKAVLNGVADSAYRVAGNGCAVPGIAAGIPASITAQASDADGSYEISWGSSSTAGAIYQLEEATNSSFTGAVQVYSGTLFSVLIGNRNLGEIYYYRVKAIKTGYSSSAYRTAANGCAVPGTPAEAPGNISVLTFDADGTYNVSWVASATTGVTYELQEATNLNFTAGLRTAYTGTATSTSITGRDMNMTYYYRVRATKNGYQPSDYRTGNNGCAVPGSSLTGVPSSLTVLTNDADGSYLVSWGASATTGVTYELQEATDNAFASNLRTAYVGTALSANITSRSQNQTYYYRIRAIKSGYKDSSYRIAVNGCAVPGSSSLLPPVSLSVPLADTDGSYTVSWGASTTPGVTYELQEARSSTFTSGLRTVYVGTNTAVNITGGSQDVTYYYRIRAIKAGYKDSSYRMGAMGCAVPGTLTATVPVGLVVPAADADGSYTVSWGPSSTAGVSYELQEATTGTFSSGLRTVSVGTATTANITGRVAGKSYYYRVKAIKGGYKDSAYVKDTAGCAVGP